MAKMEQFRDPDLSLWQSAVDEIVAKKTAGGQSLDVGGARPIVRPDLSQNMVRMATAEAKAVDDATQKGEAPPKPPAAPKQAAAEAIGDTVRYCSALARNYAIARFLGNQQDEERYHALLTEKMGDCDPSWVEAAVKYAEFLASKGKIPYRRHQKLSDFVIDGKLPANARVALVGDWGTGQTEAKTVLAQIARKKPHAVIHMGDIYYSATDFEVENYFYNIWRTTLDLSKIPTYTLSGNHDMFCGGAPYYRLIDKLGQPASYFCLRNDAWQFLAVDTGLHDGKPGGKDPTYLEDTEVQWLADKVQNRGNRRSVLLSHHQLFAAFEDICGKAVNEKLNAQVSPLLPNIDIWFWGHEHNLVVYKKYMGVLGRCIGHGAFPVGLKEIPAAPKFPEVPIEPVRLGGDIFYNHGYVIVDLKGSGATIQYYQDADEDEPQHTDTL